MTSGKYKKPPTLEDRIEGKKEQIKRAIKTHSGHENREQRAKRVLDIVEDLEVLIMKKVRRDLKEN